MPTMDSAAKAALDQTVICPAFFIYLDIQGDPIRVTTFGQDVTFSGTGDADLDGLTFSSVSSEVLSVGEVENSEGGSDTLLVDLSGVVTIDTALLNDIGNTSKWRGRPCRLWFRIYDENDVAQGAIVPYYTGYASAVEIFPSPETQMIRLKVENYLAAFNQASNRSYLNQKDYDSADTSAQATIAAANGTRRNGGPFGGGTYTGGSGFLGSIFDRYASSAR